jgi:ribose transport system permease protein
MTKVDLSGARKYAVMFVVVGLMVLFSLTSPYFLTARNLANLVMQNTYFIIVAVGLAFVMIGGGIDLSVGYQMSLVGVVTAMLMVESQQPAWLAVAAGLVLGTLLGLVNGLIVTSIRIFPLIATLATAAIFQGISYLTTHARTFRDFPEDFLVLTRGKLFGVPVDVLLALAVIVLATIVFNEMVYGSRLKALGGNEEGSRLAGINIRRMKISSYTLCGFLTAVGTMVMISKANTTNSSFGPGTEFICLTAAIVGGISFMGGEGSIPPWPSSGMGCNWQAGARTHSSSCAGSSFWGRWPLTSTRKAPALSGTDMFGTIRPRPKEPAYETTTSRGTPAASLNPRSHR